MKDEDYFAEMLANAVGTSMEDGHIKASLDAKEIAERLNLDEGELESLTNFVISITQQSLLMGMANGSFDPKRDSYEGTIVTTSTVTAMLVAKSYFQEQEKKRLDDEKSKYPVTLMAEAHVRNYRTSGDLDAIWPSEVVKEVLEEFSPEEAFIVGVVCGKSHG